MKLKPVSSIKADLGINPNGRVQAFFTDDCKRHMERYVPYDVGNLRTIVTTTPKSITYESPYAHYMYVGKVYVMPQNQKSAFYSDDYGFWSKKGQAKIPTDRDISYKTPRHRFLLG